MAAAGYMTIGDVQSIWTSQWDATRFNFINIRIAEMLNFLVHGDSTTNVTNTGCLPILEQISEEILLELEMAAKATGTNNPWNFIQARISKMDWRYYDNYLLKKVRQKLGHTKIEMVTRRLPTTTDSNVIP